LDSGIFTTASTNLIYSTTLMALIALYHEDLVVKPWMTFVAYQILNIVTSGVVMFGNRFIPAINKFSCEWLMSVYRSFSIV
jgi:choline transport protein